MLLNSSLNGLDYNHTFKPIINIENSIQNSILNVENISEISWGITFPGVVSNNLNLTCRYNNYPICCDALNEDDEGYESNRNSELFELRTKRTNCSISKVYFASPYEERHLNLSFEIGANDVEYLRRDAYIKYMFSARELNAARIWLQRVKIHAQSESPPEITSDDYEYLSRFIVTKTCTMDKIGIKHKHDLRGARKNETDSFNLNLISTTTTWTEWIEPLSMHARHPFAFGYCSDLVDVGFNLPGNIFSLTFIFLK